MLSGMSNAEKFRESIRRAAEKRGIDGDEVIAQHDVDREIKTQRTNELLDGGTLDLDALDEQTEKVRENRLRRMAGRQGLRLVKSRRRDPRAIGYGGFMIVDQNNVVVAGEVDSARALDLDAVEQYLTS
jgi:hypothetical protein